MRVLTLIGLCFFPTILVAQHRSPALMDFRKADSVAACYPRHSLKNLKDLADKLTIPLMSETEKFRSIYKWVCENIDYDVQMNTQNQHRRAKAKTTNELSEWNTTMRARVFQTLLTKQRSVCTGYAYLVSELSSFAGLSCRIVDGYGRTVQANIGGSGIANHSWNAVQLEGKWYLADPTWSAGAYDREQHTFLRRYNNAYFLADPNLFIRNHYPLDSSWTLLEDPPSLQQFLNRPLIYSDVYTYTIHKLSPDTYTIETTKHDLTEFAFNCDADFRHAKFELKVQLGSSISTSAPQLSRDESGAYSFGHLFPRKGIHFVHLLVDNNYLATYRVVVK
jgi:transglutaminase/protease-like cytokinesis protein 3